MKLTVIILIAMGILFSFAETLTEEELSFLSKAAVALFMVVVGSCVVLISLNVEKIRDQITGIRRDINAIDSRQRDDI